MKFAVKIKNTISRYPVSLLIIATIIYLSLFKPADSDLYKIPNIDKAAHFCMYAGLCSVLWFEYLRSHRSIIYRKVLLGAIVAPIVFSGTIEIVQNFLTVHRSGDWLDFIFNILGVFIAAFIGLYVIKPIISKYNLYCSNAGN